MATQASIDKVNLMYVAYYGRPGDPAGVNFWADVLDVNGGELTASIISAFGTSAEFTDRFGSLSDEELIDNLYLQMFNRTADPEGKAFYLEQIALGNMSLGDAALDIANGAQGSDLTILNNKINVAGYYTEQVEATGAEYEAEHIDDAAAILAGVTDDPVSVVVQKELVDDTLATQGGEGSTFNLTTGLDNIIGTSNDDTITGLVEDSAADTLTLGDSVNGGAGMDLLKIFSDTDNLSFGGLDTSFVESLLVINAMSDWDNVDLAGRQFDYVTLDVGGLSSGGLVIDNIDAASAVTLTNIEADYETNYFYFNTGTESTGSTTVTVSDLDASDSNEYFETYAAFSSATVVDTIVNLSDLDDQGNGYDIDYYHELDLGTTMGVAANTTFNIQNVSSADSADVEFYVYQDGGVAHTFTANLTNTDNVYAWFYLDDDGNGSSSSDVATVNLDGVMNSDSHAEVYVTDAETFNVNVLSDSELENIGNYYNGDGSPMGSVAVNVDLQGNLVVADFWDLSDDSGLTENTTFTITGSGNLTVDDFDDGSSNVTVDGSAATGDISLEGLESEVVSVTTGSGNDNIEVGSDETAVSTGAGDDTVDTNGFDFGLDADSAQLDGGAGIDTIAINNGANLDADTAANIANFEVLDVTGGTGTYDMDVETSLKDVVAAASIAAAVTIDNAAADVALTLNAFSDADAITMAQKDGTGTDDQLELNLNAVDTNTDQTADGETSAVVIADEYETINLASNASTASEESAPGAGDALTPADYNNTVNLDVSDATELTISGNAMATVTFADAAALLLVDASANEAGVDVDATTGAIASGVTFAGTDAADTYAATDNGDLIQGNGGADSITLGVGAGDDTVRYASASDSQLSLIDTDDPADGVADVAQGYDVITGFGLTGTDLIELSSQLGLATGDARADMLQKGNIGGTAPADLQAFIGDGVDFFDTGVVDRATAFAHDGVDGYLFVDANNDGNFTEADDMVVQLAGVLTLDIVDITFG